ncbi:hypothetical protein GGU10DRAFT_331746 [Lentinula aff. detonsa]|uniref:C2H2-type domain-containing protein n=1 Tax=Lentinula aff. detonsa TaxID=2804958 RepID=A0AA38NML8_9AGAR|nr:hypothetical protein GGU10DRAFT_331746 [Lentinula aff. detonsa]
MIHPEPSLPSTACHPLPFGSSRPFYLDASENEYYRSTASSICSEASHFPQSDSDDPDHVQSATVDYLQTIIATVSESQLRATMLRLAGRSTQFRNAIEKELEIPSPSRTTKSRRRSRKVRRSTGSNTSCPPISTCSNCGQVFDSGDTDACHYHPGHLEDEMFEFMSKTPEGRIFKVLKSVSMWSCCEEDPGSIGCASAPVHIELDRID